MARRALGKPPAYVMRRAVQELQAEAERFLGPRRARSFNRRQLLDRMGARTIEELWDSLASRPYAAVVAPLPRDLYETLCPGDSDRILRAAERALAHRVDLLGSGLIDLGPHIDWHKDYKSGFRWPPEYCRDIDYMNPGRPSDVKFPWELSRQQWLIPCGQAWLLTGDERWAAGARRVVEHWIDANPYAGSVNWSCTMEAAIRILTWTWLFHACGTSAAWSDESFQVRFLSSLYMHADFTNRHIEYADVNGNHCDADAAALVFAGLFFGGSNDAGRWLERGWKILCDELPRQVSEDGVDFEGSVPYHRLVAELFFLPALYRERCGLQVPGSYRDRVIKMGWFTEAYTRPDGSAPVWGDADDARALPFGRQNINDHRYLLGWIGEALGDSELARRFDGDRAECVWLLGLTRIRSLVARPKPTEPLRSILFAQGGYAVLRNERDHVFIDCGSVGTAGRGGHGHNDVLSFEAFLDGVHVVTDCGAYVYTADYKARNAFRSTRFHNTPQLNGEEVNRFIGPEDLWWLRNDARPQIVNWRSSPEGDVLIVSHTGYQRLPASVTPVRTFTLDHRNHALHIQDRFEGDGAHVVTVPLHLDARLSPVLQGPGQVICTGAGKSVQISSSDAGAWRASIEEARVSASYGQESRAKTIVWRRKGTLAPLSVTIQPRAAGTD
jgi:uncharacterized heparinase superfamily protein